MLVKDILRCVESLLREKGGQPGLHGVLTNGKALIAGGQTDALGSSISGAMMGDPMGKLARRLWGHDEGQDIAEYAVMLAVILVVVVGTIRLVGSSANNAFSSVASSL